jgi:hypothetical protein
LIAVLAILIVATALAAVAIPQKAEAATLKGMLRHAKSALRTSQDRLEAAQAALAAAVAADPGLAASSIAEPAAAPAPTSTLAPSPTPSATPTPASTLSVEELQARVAKARHAVRVWHQRVRRLARQYRQERLMSSWEAHHQWMPLIKVAAAKYHVSADGMYRMMMRESGGQQYAGSSSSFKGLFQYYTGTWASSWNPYRQDDIFDGSSQIFATAYAIHKGMGPSMWTTTFASQY